jgi:formate/nitrite transporter FocA (FNT family)
LMIVSPLLVKLGNFVSGAMFAGQSLWITSAKPSLAHRPVTYAFCDGC